MLDLKLKQARLEIKIIYISWNRNIKIKIIFNYSKFWFYVQIKHFLPKITALRNVDNNDNCMQEGKGNCSLANDEGYGC